VEGFRKLLFEQLKDNETPREEQERIVGYLYALDAQVDPAIYFLNIQQRAIFSKLEKCVKRHSRKLDVILKKKHHTAKLEEKWKDLNDVSRFDGWDSDDEDSKSTKTSMSTRSSMSFKPSANYGNNELQIQQVTNSFVLEKNAIYSDEVPDMPKHMLNLVEGLTQVMIDNIPEFWRLCNNVLTGKYFKSNSTRQMEIKESEINKLFTVITANYQSVTKQAMDSLDTGRAHQPYLFKCRYTCVNLYSVLVEKLEDIPVEYLSSLQKFTHQLRSNVVSETWNRTATELKRIYIAEPCDANQTPGSVLPAVLRLHMTNTIKCVAPFIKYDSVSFEKFCNFILNSLALKACANLYKKFLRLFACFC